MKFLLLVALCLVPFYGRVDGLLGGQQATLGQFPSHAYFVIANNIHCGGSILNANTLITAASCFFTDTNELRDRSTVLAYVGTIQVNPLPQALAVHAIFVHQLYDPNSHLNDIALIRLVQNINFPVNDTVPATAIANLNDRIIPTDEVCTFAAFNPPTQTALQFITLQRAINAQCDTQLNSPDRVRNVMICTQATAVNVGPCVTNRGSGLFCNGNLTGIIIDSFGCGAVNTPAIFTDVRFYAGWIQQTLTRTDIPPAGPTQPPGTTPGGGASSVTATLILVAFAFIAGIKML